MQKKDPDGIFLVENDGMKYIYIVEMKSSYIPDNIVKAKDHSFCFNFQRDKTYRMPEKKCKAYFFPLNVPEITLYYIAVPGRSDSHTVDFRKIIT